MTDKPEALRLADILEKMPLGECDQQAATELRRLHEEYATLDRIASDLQHLCDKQAVKLAASEALLKKALVMLESMPVKHPDQIGPRDALCAELRERLYPSQG